MPNLTPIEAIEAALVAAFVLAVVLHAPDLALGALVLWTVLELMKVFR